MSEKVRVIGELAPRRLRVLIGNGQRAANYRRDDIQRQAFVRLRLIKKGGDVIYQ